MKRFLSISALSLTGLGGLLAAGAIGCYCDHCGGVSGTGGGKGSVDVQPLGSFVQKFQEIQANKAEAADFVIYPDEWYQGGIDLGPYGQYHLAQMIKRLPTVPFPVVIQPVSDVATNGARQQVVVKALTLANVPDAGPRVIIAYSDAEGLSGVEAEISYYRMLYQSYLQNGFFNRRGLGGLGGSGGLGLGGLGGGNLLGGFGGGGGFGAFGSGFGGLYGGGF